MSDDKNFLKFITKIRTPIALAGVALVILYFIYHKILDLGIYSKINQDATVYLLGTILDKVFWLALIATTLACCSYIISLIIKMRHHRKSIVELVDAHISNTLQNKKLPDDNN